MKKERIGSMKKFASVVLALILALAMAVPAMADGYTITINNKTDGYEYAAYQIFAGDLSGTTLSNIKWGDGVDGAALLAELKANGTDETLKTLFATCSTAADVAKQLVGKGNDSDTMKKFADIVGKHLKKDSAKTSNYDASNEKYTISGLAAGYYLVKNTKVPTGEATDTAYTRYILEVVKNVEVAPKSAVPSVDKKIIEGEQEKDKNEASIGDTINYKWVGTLPSNIADYNTYYYSFNDTMDKGLTLDRNSEQDGIQTDVKVEIVNDDTKVDVTKYFYIGATKEDDGTTKLQVAIKDLLALRNIENTPTIDASTEIVVTYSATLNKDAEVGTTGNKNKVDLTYSNDPNQDGHGTTDKPEENPKNPPQPDHPTGKTPEDVVETFTTEIIIKKVDQDGKPLTGAEFTITGDGVKVVVTTKKTFVEDENGTDYKLKNGSYTKTAPTTGGETDNSADYESTVKKYKATEVVTVLPEETGTTSVKAYVGDDGELKFTGLGAGNYTIKETVTPPGYNTVADSIVEIKWAAADNGCTWTYKWKNGDETNDNTVTIVNVAGSILPSTGGTGTVLIYAAGGLLVAAAIVLLISKRRADAR